MNNFLLQYLFVLVPFVVIDGIWLSTMAPRFYHKHIGHLLSASPNWAAAVVFYALYMVGIVAFVVGPAVSGGQSLLKTFLFGGLFGFIAYATYDLTNHATMKDWPLTVTVVDMIWGFVLTGLVSLIAAWALKQFLG